MGAKECVVGRGCRTSPSDYNALLLNSSRRAPRLLRDRLSHLAEGRYDLEGDVVRLPDKKLGTHQVGCGDKMAIDAASLASDMSGACGYTGTEVHNGDATSGMGGEFRRRSAAGTA